MQLGEDFNGRGWRGPLYQADEFRFQLDPEDEELVTEEPWVGNPDGSASWVDGPAVPPPYDGPENGPPVAAPVTPPAPAWDGPAAPTTPAWDPPAAPTPAWDPPAKPVPAPEPWDGP